MNGVSLFLTVFGVFLQSIAVIFSLKRLFKPRYSEETSPQQFSREKNEDIFTLIFVLGGMTLQIFAILIEFSS